LVRKHHPCNGKTKDPVVDCIVEHNIWISLPITPPSIHPNQTKRIFSKLQRQQINNSRLSYLQQHNKRLQALKHSN
jgi:hypothetical protein